MNTATDPKPYKNTGLFADYFLDSKLPSEKIWKDALSSEQARQVFESLKALYVNKKAIFSNLNEAQTEEEFIRPVLDSLGFQYIVQTPAKSLGKQQTPDYALFATEEIKNLAYSEVTQNNYSNALAIADAKYWDRPLDKLLKESRDTFTNQNPTFQISSYLIATKAKWAILTNGRKWRLYSRDHSQTLGEYYEIDLPQLLESDQIEQFLYFYMFFRKDAYQAIEQESFLDQLIDQSIQYGAKISANLKSLIFEQIFKLLAKGFYEWTTERAPVEQKLDSKQEKQLMKDIFDNTLILLYRLLFILYAESRDLLPVKETHGYYTKSLSKIKQAIYDDIHAGRTFSKVSTDYWDDLVNLFNIIDLGDAAFNIPKYNGGLFSAEHSFLYDNKISDFYLSQAVYLLTTYTGEQTDHRTVFVDYKALGVRQLGSIYEGLLEFHLSVAEEELAIVKEKGKEKYFPVGKISKGEKELGERIAPGDIYLENTKAERRATGSYYTPHYIVEYIVNNTVGELLNEIEISFNQKVEELRTGKDKNQPAKWKNIELQNFDPVKKALELKICDPAMGSGHFLVTTVDIISNRIYDLLNKYSGKVYFGKGPDAPVYESSLLKEINDIRQNIFSEMERQNVTIDREKLEDDKVIIRRMVMKRCIFGVDLNYLAVELAKLSLWLNSFTVGAPLSFLDHHLRCGNSLVGISVDEVREELSKAVMTKQGLSTSLFGTHFAGLIAATDAMIHVGELTDSTFSELRESHSEYDFATKRLAPYKEVLDIWISEYFSNKGAKFLLEAGWVDPDNFEESKKKLDKDKFEIIGIAERLKQEERFFHWELEFPEVFYQHTGKKHNPGFDAVIGNPPYVGFQGDYSKEFLRKNYISALNRFDLYMPFIEIATKIVHQGGIVSYICPTTFILRKHGYELRKLLIDKARPIRVHDFLDKKVFQGAQNYTGIFIFKLGNKETDYLYSKGDLDSMPNRMVLKDAEDPWFANSSVSIVSDKTISLGKLATGISEGIVTGYNPAFMLGEGYAENVIKDIIEGSDINRFDLKCNKKIIYPYEKLDSKTTIIPEEPLKEYSPKSYAHLTSYKSKLAGRDYMSQTSKLWYELWRPRDIHVFNVCKLVTPKLNRQANFGIAGNDIYYMDTVYGIVINEEYSNYYLLSVLNSKLTTNFLKSICPPKANGYFSNEREFLQLIQVRRIAFITNLDFRLTKMSVAKKLYNRLVTNDDWNEIAEFIADCLGSKHNTDKLLLAKHNAEPINKDWQIPEGSLWEQSDVIHDFLAFLAEQMIELNKRKKSETQDFLDWLEHQMKIAPDKKGSIGIEALTNKSRLKNYVGDYQKSEEYLSFEELLKLLEKNKNKIGVSLSSRDFFETLKTEYQKSLDTLLPINDKLAKTDALIDQIVYKLYDLTEEDIKIIEGGDAE